MFFNYKIEENDINNDNLKNINYRDAVRAIIIRGNNILMINTNKGDYKFPGGGINIGESHEEALRREVAEEAGYILSVVKRKLGVVYESNLDTHNDNSLFKMTSHYYLCEVNNNKTIQNLDDYEKELDFKDEWIDLDEAIKINERILKEDKNKINAWVERETYVLKEIQNNYMFLNENTDK